MWYRKEKKHSKGCFEYFGVKGHIGVKTDETFESFTNMTIVSVNKTQVSFEHVILMGLEKFTPQITHSSFFHINNLQTDSITEMCRK